MVPWSLLCPSLNCTLLNNLINTFDFTSVFRLSLAEIKCENFVCPSVCHKFLNFDHCKKTFEISKMNEDKI